VYGGAAMADHPLFAAVYERSLARTEAAGLGERRQRLLAGARGRVLEIGAGTGVNLGHYPASGLSELVALEPDGAMRRRLLPRLAASGLSYEVEQAGIDEAKFEDGSFDTIVATLVLCTVPNLDSAARQIRRWLAPDGQLLFLEHVHSPGWHGRAQQVANPLWSLFVGGCRLDRDTLAALRRADLFVTDCERFAFPRGGPLLASCVQGIARTSSVPAGPDRP
jgi:SAM-dependent methyltransferase